MPRGWRAASWSVSENRRGMNGCLGRGAESGGGGSGEKQGLTKSKEGFVVREASSVSLYSS
jgi:hypothetical protein